MEIIGKLIGNNIIVAFIPVDSKYPSHGGFALTSSIVGISETRFSVFYARYYAKIGWQLHFGRHNLTYPIAIARMCERAQTQLEMV
jgi:hypothetical protein